MYTRLYMRWSKELLEKLFNRERMNKTYNRMSAGALQGWFMESYQKRGGMTFNLLSSLRWGMVLVLNFGVIHGVRGFL